MIRTIKVAKDVAVKARTSAMITLKQVLVNAPPALREELQPLSKMTLIRRCAALRPGKVDDLTSAAKHTLRSIARRWLDLDTEITAHEKLLAELTTAAAPDLVAAFAVGPDTAAEMLIVAGDNPDRVRSEAAFARLCGVAPIPASSGMTTRHRLNRGGHRQANAALYRVVIVRMQHHAPTKAYLARRTAEGKTKAEIIRCLKRLLARELWAAMRPRQPHPHSRLTAIGASTPSPRRPTACTRPSAYTDPTPPAGTTSTNSSWPPCPGSTGSTRPGYTATAATSRQQSTKQRSMLPNKPTPPG